MLHGERRVFHPHTHTHTHTHKRRPGGGGGGRGTPIGPASYRRSSTKLVKTKEIIKKEKRSSFIVSSQSDPNMQIKRAVRRNEADYSNVIVNRGEKEREREREREKEGVGWGIIADRGPLISTANCSISAVPLNIRHVVYIPFRSHTIDNNRVVMDNRLVDPLSPWRLLSGTKNQILHIN